ncbi:MAG TPA: tetratricopeptide repeat protein [Bryobacteraceae bacterium]|jgi:serine/threonine-protein kinase|nr:tetratricopeptide repeat protein [Bryobacteraceae bacterium]HXJ41108.1 tetratricopeptide repeat protein [Bryobacteraceae bacterium]
MPGSSPKRQRAPGVKAGGSKVPPAQAIRSQLKNIVGSEEFAKSERLRRFLRYTVDLALSGKAEQLNQYAVGRDVFDRGESYDPRIDSIVRVEACRLRAKLRSYYETHHTDRVLIEFPPGTYAPKFREKTLAPLASRAVASARSNTIAVLPFANLGPDADQDFLCDGVTEAILNKLATVPELSVVARTSVFHFKGKTGDVREIGARLGAGTIVEGTVRKAGDQLRVSAMAVKVADGCSLWSSTFDREMADIFAIQDEIASAVADSLRVRLAPPQQSAVNPEAYKWYLKGRQHWNRATREGFEAAVADFNRSVALAPGFAAPYTGLADAYTWLWILGLARADDVVPKARQAALEAVRLDPFSADAHTLLGVLASWHDWNWDEGTRLLQKARELAPSSIKAISFSGLELVNLGRFSDALIFLQKSLQLDPLAMRTYWALGLTCYMQRQYDQAIEWVRKGLELGEGCGSRRLLGYVYLRKHRYADAAEEMRRSLAEPPVAYGLAGLGETYGCWGKKEKAREILQELETLSTTEYVPAISRVRVYAGLGDWEHAFDWLERAYKEHNVGLAVPEVDPRYEHVQSDPRLRRLLKRVGLV